MRALWIILILSLLFFPSCASLDVFEDGYTLSEELTVEEKLVLSGGKEVMVDHPECYYDGGAFLDRLEELVEDADEYILISTFLGSLSPRLERFYSLLQEKAESGVAVYFMMDAVSSYDMTASKDYMTPLYFLRESGVHLHEFSPLTSMHLIAPQVMFLRDHRKLMVFDGEYAVLGGMNLNYISLGASDDEVQRDSMYVFSSRALSSALTDAFVSVWNAASVDYIPRSLFHSYPYDYDGSLDAYLFNQGGDEKGRIAGMYASLINSAEKEILMFPYLPVMDKKMEASIRRAIDRGVKVKMLIPLDTRGYAKGGVSYLIPKLVDMGMELYVTEVGSDGLAMLHEKLMVVDGRYTVIGSSNFNYRTMSLAYEIALVLDSTGFAAESEEHFYSRIDEGSFYVSPEKAEEIKKESGSWLGYMLIYYGG